ncbi:MAG: hypothetical protein ACXVWZ_06755 [Nocardioides sp.]
MMAMAHAGFVFLSMTKTGSTAVQRHFEQHAQLLVRQPPAMKHMTARTFRARVAPLLERYGFPRESYELVAIVRDPVDWAESWWRYRSRPAARGKASYTGDLGFDEFAERLVAGDVFLGSSANFVSDGQGRVLVERLYKYEHLDQAAAWMAERLGVESPTLTTVNASPQRGCTVSPATRALLEEHLADDLAVYRSAR